MTAIVLTEKQLQRRIIDLAKLTGWRACHFRPARMADGKWRTPVEGDVGLPDVILARDGVVLLCELKSAVGSPTADQAAWLIAAGDHARLWRPDDWDTIVATLTAKATA